MIQTNIPRAFILMLGAPGVGKGTYSNLLQQDFSLNQISSGDELRDIINQNLPSSKPIPEIKEAMINGKLVDDSLALSLVFAKLSTPQYKNGAILDGFPRTITQAKVFERIHKLNLIIKIDMDESVIVRKMLGRRLCMYCGKGYNDCCIKENGYDLPKILPINDKNKCDHCSREWRLIKREDDNATTILKRIQQYKTMTKSVEEYYQDRIFVFQPKKGLRDYYKLKDYVKNNLI